jgi:hypothetical protein
VCAPAGYGKSTAVSSWIVDQDISASWTTCDRADNDPVRLWARILDGVSFALDSVGEQALARLRESRGAAEPAITVLADELARTESDIAIVLNDVHELDRPECLATVSHALTVLPAGVRLVLVGRRAPGLRLSRLRANGRLAELETADLAFTRDEADRSTLFGALWSTVARHRVLFKPEVSDAEVQAILVAPTPSMRLLRRRHRARDHCASSRRTRLPRDRDRRGAASPRRRGRPGGRAVVASGHAHALSPPTRQVELGRSVAARSRAPARAEGDPRRQADRRAPAASRDQARARPLLLVAAHA